MKITFGMSLDGYEPPEQENNIGVIVTGPMGFLDLLETRLGLSGDWPAQSLRVIQYQKCLNEADIDKNKMFYSESFSVDGFTVAETLLNWRDEWVMTGWDGTAVSSDSKRIQDMALVEVLARDQLGMGVTDRLQSVIKTMEERTPAIDEVQLVDPLIELPPVWQKILEKLTVVQQSVNSVANPSAPDGSDLSALQNALLTNTPAKFNGDGSFFIIESASEYNLARAIGESFASPDAWGNGSTTVISGKRGAVLDEGFQSIDLPISGQTNNSIWRPTAQVLRLALSLLWDPLDPHRLLEFLAHPVCPVRQPLRSRLAKVVANTPGIGGDDWNKVIHDVCLSAIKKADGDAKAGESVEEQVNTWLKLERFDPAGGAPVAVLAEHCSKVARWALSQANNPNIDDAQRSSFLSAQMQANSAAESIDEMAKAAIDVLTKIQLDRLIDQVTAYGGKRPDVGAECGHIHVIAEAAAAIASVDRVVWWDFSSPDLPRKWPWTPDEIEQLRAHKADLPNVDSMLQFAATTWLRPVMAATKQLVIVMPKRRGSEAFVHHPLWDQILMAAKNTKIPKIEIDRSLDKGESPNWISVRVDSVAYRGLPKPNRWWKIKDGKLLGSRAEESFSSLESFIHKPHVWVLRYKAKLMAGSLADISEDNRQKGKLLHRLVEWLFTSDEIDWRTTDEEMLKLWIDKHFLVLLEQEGANYLLPGKKQTEEDLRSTGAAAIWSLIVHLRTAKVYSVRVEECVEGRFKGGNLTGDIDMLVSQQGGNEAVVDLKWGGFKYRKEELSENKQLQLAVYAEMRRHETKRLPAQAYFIIEDGRMLVQDNHYFEKATECKPKGEFENTTTLWTDFQNTWVWRREQLDEGSIEINVEATQADENSVSPEGSLPINTASDRFDDYVVLTGWPEGA